MGKMFKVKEREYIFYKIPWLQVKEVVIRKNCYFPRFFVVGKMVLFHVYIVLLMKTYYILPLNDI